MKSWIANKLRAIADKLKADDKPRALFVAYTFTTGGPYINSPRRELHGSSVVTTQGEINVATIMSLPATVQANLRKQGYANPMVAVTNFKEVQP